MNGIIQSSAELIRFCYGKPWVRRWFVSRVFQRDDPEARFYVDLYFAPAREPLLQELGFEQLDSSVELIERFLLDQTADRLDWWDGEDFDTVAHMPVLEFRQLLNDFSSYPADQPIEEGMVFVEISKGGSLRFVQFSIQARNESRTIFRKLMDGDTEEGEENGAG